MNERKPHVLKSIKKFKKENAQYIYVDTETKAKDSDKNILQKFYNICWVNESDDKNYFYETSLQPFYDYIKFQSLQSDLYIYAHNMKGFDSLVMKIYKYLPSINFKLVDLYDEGSFFAVFQHQNINSSQKIYFVDTLNYFKGSLKQIAINLGIEVKKFDLDFNKKISKKEYIIRVKSDVKILMLIMKKYKDFLFKHKLGKIKLTVASQSMQTFLYKFYNDGDIFIHNITKVLERERESYAGGRTEVFKMGFFKDIYCCDINSMYSYNMKERSYPVKFIQRIINNKKTPITLEDLKNLLKNYCIISNVELNINSKIAPYPKKINNKLYFLVGEYNNTLCTAELIHAIKNNYITKVNDVCIYDKKSGLFKDYVDYFFHIKDISDLSTSYLCKNKLNNLYGKFGQLNKGWENIGECDPVLYDEYYFVDENNIKYKRRRVAGLHQQLKKPSEFKETFNSFCAIASHVTSYARIQLLEYMEIVGYGNFIYSDTDSLFCTKKGYNNLLKAGKVSRLLGNMKLENIYITCKINGLKDYEYTYKDKKGEIQSNFKLKGIGKSDIKISNNEYQTLNWDSLSKQLHYQNEEYTQYKRIKKLSRNYSKGINDNDIIIPYKENELKGE